MKCQKCGKERVMDVTGKTADMCFAELNGAEEDGYVPRDIGIGGGDYIRFAFCLDCGQIQGEWPVQTPEWAEREEET